MVFRKQTLSAFLGTFFFAAIAHSAPNGMYGCGSVFGSSGQKVWLVGLDVRQGNLLATQLTTDKVSGDRSSFGAATVHIRNHILGPDKTLEITAGDSMTFCQDLSISVGSQLQLHWQGKASPEVVVYGGGESQLGCFYGHINDPFSNSLNPFFGCVSQGPIESSAYDLISKAFQNMTAPKVKEFFCDRAANEHSINFLNCSEKVDSIPALYPGFAEQINGTVTFH